MRIDYPAFEAGEEEDMLELGAHTASMQAQLAELLGQLDERSERLSGWSDSEPDV